MSELIEQIRAAYRLEIEDASPLTKASDIPISFEAITLQWLTSVISQRQAGIEVLAFRLGPPDEGNTSRRRIFLQYNDVGTHAGLPTSVFCKATQRLASRMSVGIPGGVHAEVTFYNKIRPLLKIEAPECIWANYSTRSLNSIIVLHDLGQQVEFCTLATPMDRDRAQSQMALLATIHGQFYREADADAALAGLATWPAFFDRVQQLGLQQLCANGFQAAEAVIPRRLYMRWADIWPATLASVQRHQYLPHTLLHSDVHLRNWYVAANGGMGLNDWQGACRGHWSRDVAYAIATALPLERRRVLERDLLEYYLELLRAAGGPAMNLDEAWTCYRQQLFSALAWWTITLSPSADMPDMQPRESTLEMIKRISHAIDDLDALSSFKTSLR
jgi:hypothetical protein